MKDVPFFLIEKGCAAQEGAEPTIRPRLLAPGGCNKHVIHTKLDCAYPPLLQLTHPPNHLSHQPPSLQPWTSPPTKTPPPRPPAPSPLHPPNAPPPALPHPTDQTLRPTAPAAIPSPPPSSLHPATSAMSLAATAPSRPKEPT